MELNIEVKLKSTYNKETDCNEFEMLFNSDHSLSEVLTIIEKANLNAIKILEDYIKNTPNGAVTNDEFKELINSPISFLLAPKP